MPVKITTGESNIAVSYRFTFPNGYVFKVIAVPLDTRTAREVLGNVTEDYTLIIPIAPPGIAFPFLSGMQQNVSYVTVHTGITGTPLDLITLLLPVLTTVPPVDELLPVAQAWFDAL